MSEVLMEHVSKIFKNNMPGLRNVNLKIEKGEFVFLLGRSGAGKSTLMKLITRELEPTRGEIYVDGQRIDTIKRKDIAFLRRKMGIIKQERTLLEHKTVYENVAFALVATEQPKKVIEQSVPAALGLVGMRKKADCMPSELSGGEKFRIELARAVVNNPSILIADEPTANLDPDSAWDIMCLIDEINRCGITVIVATHAKQLVNIMKKRVVTLYHGQIIGDVKKGRYGDII